MGEVGDFGDVFLFVFKFVVILCFFCFFFCLCFFCLFGSEGCLGGGIGCVFKVIFFLGVFLREGLFEGFVFCVYIIVLIDFFGLFDVIIFFIIDFVFLVGYFM